MLYTLADYAAESGFKVVAQNNGTVAFSTVVFPNVLNDPGYSDAFLEAQRETAKLRLEAGIAHVMRRTHAALEAAVEAARTPEDVVALSTAPDAPFGLKCVASNVTSLEVFFSFRPVWHVDVFSEAFPIILLISKHSRPEVLAAHCGALVFALLQLATTSAPTSVVRLAHVMVRNLMRATGALLFTPPSFDYELASWVSWQLNPLEGAESNSASADDKWRKRSSRDIAVTVILDRMYHTPGAWVDNDLVQVVRDALGSLEPPQMLVAEAFLERAERLSHRSGAADTSPSLKAHQQRNATSSASGDFVVSPLSGGAPSTERAASAGRDTAVLGADEMRAFLRSKLQAYAAEEAALRRALLEQAKLRDVLDDEYRAAAVELKRLIEATSGQCHEAVERLMLMTKPVGL